MLKFLKKITLYSKTKNKILKKKQKFFVELFTVWGFSVNFFNYIYQNFSSNSLNFYKSFIYEMKLKKNGQYVMKRNCAVLTHNLRQLRQKSYSKERRL